MPHPLAYVFKRELIYIPFFGWAMGRMDMIHIDRRLRAQAFNKVVEQGKRLLAQGIWVIMFPEGTRIPRGQAGTYKSGGTRLAVSHRRAGHPDRGELGQGLAAQGLHQAARRGRRGDRQAHSQPGPQAEELMREVQAWIEGEMRRIDPEAYR
jgi:1-acyl-sn-glycerol-3-phosphate acyltransferase